MKATLATQNIFPVILLLALLSACAGPATPFGSLETWNKNDFLKKTEDRPKYEKAKREPQAQATTLQEASKEIRLVLEPKHQILHDNFDFTISVENIDENFSPQQLYFEYNNIDISSTLRRRAEIFRDQNHLRLTLKNLKLPAEMKQKISVYLLSSNRKKVLLDAKLEEPSCHPFQFSDNLNTRPFVVENQLLSFIQESSFKNFINPNLLLGLIAQESSFNPKALSWAKAMGLTQVTPVADRSIKKYSSDWPRSDKIEKASFLMLKSLIGSGAISKKDDWRLDPFYSVQGGILYLNWLKNYWGQEKHTALLSQNFGSNIHERGKVLLASYNSGAARIKKAIKRKGLGWIHVDGLEEAKKYVAKVTSYCQHFSQ